MNRSLLILCSALTLSACYTRYADPKDVPTATLLVKHVAGGGAVTYEDAATCSRRQVVTTPLEKEDRRITIPAGRPFSLSYGIDQGVKVLPGIIVFQGCNPTVTFTPEAGESYISSVVVDAQSNCAVNLVNSIAPSNPVSVQQRTWKRAMTSAGPFCE